MKPTQFPSFRFWRRLVTPTPDIGRDKAQVFHTDAGKYNLVERHVPEYSATCRLHPNERPKSMILLGENPDDGLPVYAIRSPFGP